HLACRGLLSLAAAASAASAVSIDAQCLRRCASLASLEDDGLVPVHEYAVIDMQAHCAREHDLLEITAFSDEVVDGLPVRYAGDVLFDDRTFVQLCSRVMGGRPDELHSA